MSRSEFTNPIDVGGEGNVAVTPPSLCHFGSRVRMRKLFRRSVNLILEKLPIALLPLGPSALVPNPLEVPKTAPNGNSEHENDAVPHSSSHLHLSTI